MTLVYKLLIKHKYFTLKAHMLELVTQSSKSLLLTIFDIYPAYQRKFSTIEQNLSKIQ